MSYLALIFEAIKRIDKNIAVQASLKTWFAIIQKQPPEVPYRKKLFLKVSQN